MKKWTSLIPAAVILAALLLTGCGGSASSGTQSGSSPAPAVTQADIMGYWLQVEGDDSGKITDLTNNPYAYLEVTENRLYFYSLSLNEGEGYAVADKYYILEGDQLYFDYYELTGSDFKEKLDPLSGGFFEVAFDDQGRLVLTQFNNGENKEGGYVMSTYTKVEVSDWPIEE